MLSITEVQQIWQLSSPDDLFIAFYEGTARTGGLLRAQPRETLDNIRTAVIKAASTYEKDGIVEFPMPADSYRSAKTATTEVSQSNINTLRATSPLPNASNASLTPSNG